MAHDMFRIDDEQPEAARQLHASIRKTLWDYEPLRATRPVLDISVRDGLVTLNGRVRTLAIKEISEYMLLRVPGIRAVRNELIADPEVVRAVADAIAADSELGPTCPIIEARDGVAVLAGEMPSEETAQRVVELAASVPNVVSVTSHLRVLPPKAVLATNGVAYGAANSSVAVATPEEPGAA
ncbi:MAG: BON domain-containing protein [Chloroflexi bacterium]|nr:BON domain-containing protein [Chloroflexota bacterium]